MHLSRNIDEIHKPRKGRSHVTRKSNEGLINDGWLPRSDMELGDDE